MGGSAFCRHFLGRVRLPHAGHVVPVCAGRAGREEAGSGGEPRDLVAGTQGFPALLLAAQLASSYREEEEENGGCLGRSGGNLCPAGKRTSSPPHPLPLGGFPLLLRDSFAFGTKAAPFSFFLSKQLMDSFLYLISTEA